MADYFDAGKFGAIVPFFFTVADATTNQSNVDMAPFASTTLVPMPTSGSVIGISVTSSQNVTAGTATLRAHSASTEFAQTDYPAAVLNSTNSNVAYSTVRPGALTFAAGAKLGLSYSTSTDLAPTNTADLVGVLWVQLSPT